MEFPIPSNFSQISLSYINYLYITNYIRMIKYADVYIEYPHNMWINIYTGIGIISMIYQFGTGQVGLGVG